MRVALFAPLPPVRSGVATYTARLLPHLSRVLELDVWIPDGAPDPGSYTDGMQVIRYEDRAYNGELQGYDLIVYVLGNDATAHASAFNMSRRLPGVVWLHDAYLGHFFAGYYLNLRHDREGYVEVMGCGYGARGAMLASEIVNQRVPPIWETHPGALPLLAPAIAGARGVLVHSQEAVERLRRDGVGLPTLVVPLAAPLEFLRAAGVSKSRPGGSLVVGCFGQSTPNKYFDLVKRVIAELYDAGHDVRLVTAGHQPSTKDEPFVKALGFLRDHEYMMAMAGVDIVVALREPTLGEASAVVVEAMALGKSVIVCKTGWYGDLPPRAVLQLARVEATGLRNALLSLLRDPDQLRAYGAAARQYAGSCLHPDSVAQRVRSAFQCFVAAELLKNATTAARQVGLSRSDGPMLTGITSAARSIVFQATDELTGRKEPTECGDNVSTP